MLLKEVSKCFEKCSNFFFVKIGFGLIIVIVGYCVIQLIVATIIYLAQNIYYD